MEYLINRTFVHGEVIKRHKIENGRTWRLIEFKFKDMQGDNKFDDLSLKIFKVFEGLPGDFYVSERDGIAMFCKIGEKIIVDDIIFRVKGLIKGDYICRLGEQDMLAGGIVSLQFIFSPSGSEQQKLSQEFIADERRKRIKDVIMVVEDDLFARNIAKKALQGKFSVVEVDDGSKAVQTYLSHSPDVVFLDIHLPKKQGIDVLKEIMNVDPQAFIVMLSADAAKDKVMNCVEIGAKGFIGKPFKGEKLYDYIRKCPTVRVYC